MTLNQGKLGDPDVGWRDYNVVCFANFPGKGKLVTLCAVSRELRLQLLEHNLHPYNLHIQKTVCRISCLLIKA